MCANTVGVVALVGDDNGTALERFEQGFSASGVMHLAWRAQEPDRTAFRVHTRVDLCTDFAATPPATTSAANLPRVNCVPLFTAVIASASSRSLARASSNHVDHCRGEASSYLLLGRWILRDGGLRPMHKLSRGHNDDCALGRVSN